MSEYIQKGSEWRRWDLHVHTKGTMKNDQFTSKDFETFCVAMFKKAIKNEIAAIGITDYFNIDNYNKVQKFVDGLSPSSDFNEKEIEKIKNIFILPNVELRIIPVTGKGKPINIHCLFNPSSDYISYLKNHFFGSLKHSDGDSKYSMNREDIICLGKTRNPQMNDDLAYKEGIKSFVISHEKIQDLLKDDFRLKENTIIVVSNSDNDGVSGLQEHYRSLENGSGNLSSTREAIYKMSDAIFSGTSNDRKYFLGKKGKDDAEAVKRKCGSLKPCIHGSDAHTEKKLFMPDQNRYCWIKSDLTFEGLKQILYEPDDRVKIQEPKPDYKESYRVIDSVQFQNEKLTQEKFTQEKLYLNQNLTAIIGGRSTGKSILLGSIASAIDTEEVDSRFEENYNSIKPNICIENFEVVWVDGQESIKNRNEEINDERENKVSNKKIIYIPQSYLNRLAEKEEGEGGIHTIIENILIQENEEIYSRLANSKRQNNEEITTKIASLFTHIDTAKDQTEELKGLDKTGVEIEIQGLEEEITELKKTTGMSEDEITKYNKFAEDIKILQTEIQQLDSDKEQLENLKDTNLIYTVDLSDLSQSMKNEIDEFYKDLKIEMFEKWQKFIDEKLKNLTKQQQSTEDKLTHMGEGFKSLQEKANQSNLLKERIEQIRIQQSKLKEIQRKEVERKKTVDLMNKVRQELMQLHKEFYNIYLQSKTEIQHNMITSNDLEFRLEIQHKTRSFQNRFCQEIFDNRSLPDYLSDYHREDNENFAKTIDRAVYDILEGKIPLKTRYTKKEALTRLLNNWYEYDYQITQGNDDISQMSPGKRSLVLLKLLIELDDNKYPILLDQPEDDLDNRSIYTDLVKFIKDKKKERQIIIVTHNPNLVVGADAECVIVANQEGRFSANKKYQFEYVSGALESTSPRNNSEDKILYKQGICEHVCEILEGGTEAFKNREQKYGMAGRN